MGHSVFFNCKWHKTGQFFIGLAFYSHYTQRQHHLFLPREQKSGAYLVEEVGLQGLTLYFSLAKVPSLVMLLSAGFVVSSFPQPQLPLGMAVCILKMGSKNEFLIQFGTWAPEVKIKGQSKHHPQVYRHSSHWSHQRIWSRVCYFSLD